MSHMDKPQAHHLAETIRFQCPYVTVGEVVQASTVLLLKSVLPDAFVVMVSWDYLSEGGYLSHRATSAIKSSEHWDAIKPSEESAPIRDCWLCNITSLLRRINFAPTG